MVITADCFPTPDLALRSTDPAEARRVRGFRHEQAAAAEATRARLAVELPCAHGHADRVGVLRDAYDHLLRWRYELALRAPHRLGSGVPLDAERFRTTLSESGANFDRLGYLGRLRDGATWDPATRTYQGGQDTPAHRIMLHYGRAALDRFQHAAFGYDPNVLFNPVRLPDGTALQGNVLVRGRRADAVAAELVARLAGRGHDTSRVEVGGVAIYAITAHDINRAIMLDAALDLLAADRVTVRTWQQVRYLLFQAPIMKKGSDAVIRAFLVATGAVLLGRPPVLAQDVDLRCIVLGQSAATEMPSDTHLGEN